MTAPLITEAKAITERCKYCNGSGEWEVECCNGDGGCSCRGLPVPMGTCRVCGGSGQWREGQDERANLKAIEGFCFIGTGPQDGWLKARRKGVSDP